MVPNIIILVVVVVVVVVVIVVVVGVVGHAVVQCLRHCATNRKVAGSIPDTKPSDFS
jgi:hypothetical protein